MKRFLAYTLVASSILHGIASIVWFYFPQVNAGSYGAVLFWTSASLGLIACTFFQGPSGYARPEPRAGRPISAAEFDHQDRLQARSLGAFLAIIAVSHAALGLWLAGIIK